MAAVLPKGRSSTANSGTKVVVLLRMNRCDGFPLISTLQRVWVLKITPHSYPWLEVDIGKIIVLFFALQNMATLVHTSYHEDEQKQQLFTERGGSVVTHETRIREVPGSNPVADQPDWGFFRGFPQSSRKMLGWIFITMIHLTIIHQIHIS